MDIYNIPYAFYSHNGGHAMPGEFKINALEFLDSLLMPPAPLFTSCLPEGITFTTQAEIDNFQANYPGCSEIEGNVIIMGDDITNLNGLLVLTSIEGSLYLGHSDPGVPSLTSLSGLANLQVIGESLVIGNKNVGGPVNNSLLSLAGLESLTSVGNKLDIGGMHSLSNLSGLNNLTTIGGLFRVAFNNSLVNLEGLDNITSIWSIAIERNFSLINLAGLENITSTPGGISIYANSITSLSGLENLYSIEGGLSIGWCAGLDDLSGLSNLSDIGLGFEVYITNISNLSGLSNLVSIGGNFEIYQNQNLINFEGIDGLVSIGGDLSIGTAGLGGLVGNPSLVNCVGFQNLNSVGGSLIVYGNDSLSTLMGLENITSIAGDLRIAGNSSLTSLSGLDNIASSTITNLYIWDNDTLSTCQVQSICEYLIAPNGTITIEYNAPGCNSSEEVDSLCNITNVSDYSSDLNFSISPNPINENATVTLGSMFIGSINICLYNSTGICLKSWQFNADQSRQTEFQINLNEVPAGMYFLHVNAGDDSITKKIIKT
ncbi:MAG: T9SS type A sorting domain-containing protein [Bacteroidales bacterium]